MPQNTSKTCLVETKYIVYQYIEPMCLSELSRKDKLQLFGHMMKRDRGSVYEEDTHYLQQFLYRHLLYKCRRIRRACL